MARARALLFYLGLCVWTVLMGTLIAPTLVLPRRALVRACRFWDTGVIFWLRVTVGLSHRVVGPAPAGPIIVACRHQSAWETLAIATVIDDPAVVLKRELLWFPIFGWYLAAVGMIPIDRSGGASALRVMVRAAQRAVAQGRPIVMFPEGTRVAPGVRREYHPGIYALYRQLALPVVPTAVDSGRFWPRRSFAKTPGTITLQFLPAIPPGLEREAFLATLRARIESAALEPVADA